MLGWWKETNLYFTEGKKKYLNQVVLDLSSSTDSL